jgi:hypothetical protein
MKIFQLVITAIVAIALIALFFTYINSLNSPENLNSQIKKAIIQAEDPSYMGKTIMFSFNVTQNQLLYTKDFDLSKRSLAIECTDNSICCAKGEECNKIEWTEEYAQFNKAKKINFYARCLEEGISICRIYFGKMPAQAELKEIRKTSQNNLTINFEVDVKNSGKQNLSLGENKLKLYKKVAFDWEESDFKKESKNISMLAPDQEHTFLWEITIPSYGEYKAEFIFEGQNSGFDIKTIDFNINENTACQRSEKVEYVTDPESGVREIHYCEGCNYGYECYAKWKEIMPEKEWEILNKEAVYFIQ